MQYNKKSVEDIDVSGKKVIARCDFNVPQDENGNITGAAFNLVFFKAVV